MGNFFKDTPDLRHRIASAPWDRIIPPLEAGFSDPDELAPESVEEAVEQIEMVLELVGEMAAEEFAPHAAEVDLEGARLVDGEVVYPESMQRSFRLLAEAGLLGFTLPRVHGGMNLPISAYTAAVEIVARADASLMTLFALQGCGETIERWGSPETRERYLPKLCSGEITPCMALSEPNAGSALGAVSTRAVPGDDGRWTVRGSKVFITNGGADILLTLARTEPGTEGGAGLSLLVVERGPGVEVPKLEHKLGIHGSATAVVNFDDAPGVLLGGRGDGLYRCTLGLLHNVRLEVAAQAVGIAQAAQAQAATYAREREQFGRSIDQFAPVRTLLFENAAEIEAARAIIFTTAALVDLKRGHERGHERDGGDGGDGGDAGERERVERLADILTPLSKYYACEIVNAVTSRALQVHGGYGYTTEYPVERNLRDGRITNIYEGTSEIQVGAMIAPLLEGGIALLFAERFASARAPEGSAGVLESLRESYQRLTEAGEKAAAADRMAQQGWARGFADAIAHLLAALVFLGEAEGRRRAAVLAAYWAGQAARGTRAVLETAVSGDCLTFDDESFEEVVGPYRRAE